MGAWLRAAVLTTPGAGANQDLRQALARRSGRLVAWLRSEYTGGRSLLSDAAAQIEQLADGLVGGGSGMWKELRVYVVVAALAFIGVVAFLAVKLVSSARMLDRAERSRNERATVIRHPNFEPSKTPGKGEVVHNIAPLSTVTVSSIDESDERLGGGVADGVVDTKEWVAREEMAGAWIKLSWDRPALVTEIALYD